ncbi:hypothetical protein N7541_011269 [Penicillium brevicompactum]|uniref:C2H2-type domain-containing protein n=1 Tax=Penicillium brevicompactum TaxID=5074 RepID=A0A9W9QRL3_PENBR|nr:hypothetical protein N7541_011269 [Penicillium brevicompactum]
MMEWPTPHQLDGLLHTPEIRYQWPDIDMENWKPEYFTGSQSLNAFAPPELSTSRRRSSTATSHSYELQPPTTPKSVRNIASPRLDCSKPIGIDRSAIEDYLEPITPERYHPTIHPANSCEPESPLPRVDLLASIQKKLEANQADGPTSKACMDECKLLCCSRRPSRDKTQKSDTEGSFRCEWKGCRYDRPFSRKGVLMRHIEMQHVNPRSFKCPWCSHATSRRENIKAHRRSVHKEVL